MKAALRLIFIVAGFLLCFVPLVLQAEAKPNGKGQKKPPAPKPRPSQIDLMAKTGVAMNSAVVAPLGVHVPNVRDNIVQMQQDLLDEAARHPVATASTYQTANRLCNAWLSAFDERKKRKDALGQASPPGKDMDHAKKTVLHWPDDILTFAREQADAREKHEKDKQTKAFFKSAEKNNWTQRATVIKDDLDKLYGQFREQRRQPLS